MSNTVFRSTSVEGPLLPDDDAIQDSAKESRIELDELNQAKLLSREEEVDLARKIQQGDDQARERMILANLRLVKKIARNYQNYGVPLDDLINEGNIGLMKAVDKFDPDRGAKFSTYAVWWIKQSIHSALREQSRTIRLPSNVIDELSLMRRTSARLQEQLHREPTDDELAEELGVTSSRLCNLRTASLAATSIDAPLTGDSETSLSEMVADEDAQLPSDMLQEQNRQQLICTLLKRLPERYAEILRARFGFDGGQPRTLEEIGQLLGVTRERIRQIETTALRRLRALMMRYSLAN